MTPNGPRRSRHGLHEPRELAQRRSAKMSAMRFLLTMHVPTDHPRAFDADDDIIERMGRFQAELEEAGALIALEGLHPPERGARVTWREGSPVVQDGPFTEAKELFAGYWIIRAGSKDEAVRWASRIPAGDGVAIEVREIWELADLPDR